ncbi:hypothetical protein M758_UG196600 [Ceratodon purpureus]|nr:hypothetical protein M758_UG196600 [Ceratodon purpureus]
MILGRVCCSRKYWVIKLLQIHFGVYPQGCDVCNHLSLFLCVADYDKLLENLRANGQARVEFEEMNCRASRVFCFSCCVDRVEIDDYVRLV